MNVSAETNNGAVYTVWVGGGEFTNFLLTLKSAIYYAQTLVDFNYEDVQIENTATNTVVPIGEWANA